MRAIVYGLVALAIVGVLALGLGHLQKDAELAPEEKPTHVVLTKQGGDGMSITITGPSSPVRCGDVVDLEFAIDLPPGTGQFAALEISDDSGGPWVLLLSTGPRPVVDPDVGCPGGVPYFQPPEQFDHQNPTGTIRDVSFYGPVWIRIVTYAGWPPSGPKAMTGNPAFFDTVYPVRTESASLEEFFRGEDFGVRPIVDGEIVAAIYDEPFSRSGLGTQGTAPTLLVPTDAVDGLEAGAEVELAGEFFVVRGIRPLRGRGLTRLKLSRA